MTRRYRTLAFGLLAMVLAGLTTAPVAQAASDPGASTEPTLTPIAPTPDAIAPLHERTLATVGIDHADTMVQAQGSVWVKTDDGRVVRVDPTTGTVIADVKVDTTSDPYHYCQGLGTDGTAIWACSASGAEDDRTIDVVRFDPDTHSVALTVDVDMIFDQFEIPFVADRIWALAGAGDTVVGIDAATGEPTSLIPLDARCTQLADVTGSLMAACPSDDSILVIDPVEGSVSQRVPLEGPRHVDGDTDGVWVVQEHSIVRLDPATMRPVAEYAPFPGVFDLDASGDAVWVRHGIGFLFRIDPATGKVIEQIMPGESLSPGSVLVTEDSVWATANDEGLLYHLDPGPACKSSQLPC
jgi:DNA-binding beta-propeller fold protein YncE